MPCLATEGSDPGELCPGGYVRQSWIYTVDKIQGKTLKIQYIQLIHIVVLTISQVSVSQSSRKNRKDQQENLRRLLETVLLPLLTPTKISKQFILLTYLLLL